MFYITEENEEIKKENEDLKGKFLILKIQWKP